MQTEAHLCRCLGSVSEGYIHWAFMELKGRPCRTPNGNSSMGLGLLSLMVLCPCVPVFHCVSVGFSVCSGGTRFPCSEATPLQFN